MDKIEDNQIIFVEKKNYLDNVISSQEASELLNISDGYLRQLVLKGEFQAWEYKKFTRAILFYKDSILIRMNKFNSNK